MNRRLFFALWPSDAERERFIEATRNALETVEGRLLPPDNYHLTVAFLGSVAEERLDAIGVAAANVARLPLEAPIDVTLDRIEHWRREGIVVAGASTPASGAAQLAAALKEQLVRAGFAPDLKPFRAHVTLVRKVSRVRSQLHMESVLWRFAALSLVESRTRPSGALYSVLESWPLAGLRTD